MILAKRSIKLVYRLLLKLLFFFSFIFVNVNIFEFFNIYLIYEMENIEKYLKLCSENVLIKNLNFKKAKDPRISIITPVYNKEKTLPRYLRSIQNQLFNDIEIIFVDDKSEDNSIKIIEVLQKKDERIILIKNKKRKGTLISRNRGVLKSKGEFLLFVDPDDIISENILKYTYRFAKKYDYDLTRFNIYIGNYELNLPEVVSYLNDEPIFKPYIYLYLFYGLGKLLQLDYYVTNKLIKKNLFIRALNSINRYYLKQFMVDCEDGLINFMLYKLGNSLYFTRRIGYYYIKTKKSITSGSVDFKKRLKSNFLYFRFIFLSTKNNNIEKRIANYIFREVNYYHPEIVNLLKKDNKDFKLYNKTINLFLKNEFISLKSKKILKKMRKAINNLTISLL